MILMASCSIPNFGGGNNTNLQLLRIETENNLSLSSNIEGKRAKLKAKDNISDVEVLDDNCVNLIAVIKNEERASFIDIVVYNSQNK